jgi:cell division septation protein DedD
MEAMNKFDELSKRERLTGYRALVKALEPGSGFTLVQQGKVVNREQLKQLRREIAYLEAVLPPKNPPAFPEAPEGN